MKNKTKSILLLFMCILLGTTSCIDSDEMKCKNGNFKIKLEVDKRVKSPLKQSFGIKLFNKSVGEIYWSKIINDTLYICGSLNDDYVKKAFKDLLEIQTEDNEIHKLFIFSTVTQMLEGDGFSKALFHESMEEEGGDSVEELIEIADSTMNQIQTIFSQ